jgi:threonine aldolase
MIDLRSDTVTKPTPGMRAAMAAAEVGDDVFGEDPTVIRLEERVADYLGKEAALFVPSGSMSNQIALKTHTQPGDEVILDEYSHIYAWEAGTPAIVSGITCRTVYGTDGIIQLDQLRDKIRPLNEHMVRTKVVSLENTHNRGGGKIYPLEIIQQIEKWARQNKLIMHLDGARLWNAAVATKIACRDWCRHFDTVSVCFSKGLGAPVGSALAGPKDFIKLARRYRKVFGGAMRQAGIIAAGALYALDHHIDRLADDHDNAQIIAAAIRACRNLKLSPERVDTNIIWFEIDERLGTARDFAGRLREMGVGVSFDPPNRMRACTHLDVSRVDCEKAAEIIHRAASNA